MVTPQQYLTTKQTVDDRALNRRVFEQFRNELLDIESTDVSAEVSILEAGVGTGTMIPRMVSWEAFGETVTYRGVDREPESIASARQYVPGALRELGYEVTVDDRIRARRDGQTLHISLEVGDVFELTGEFDAIVASAFLDLIELPGDLASLLALLEPDGILYAPITFDGTTGFVPTHPLDGPIVDSYHHHMRAVRSQPGTPIAGRQVLEAIPALGAQILAVGGSDWVIRPHEAGYPHDERIVLEHLLDTIVEAVREVIASRVESVDRRRLATWERERYRQLKRGLLTLLAHNLDILVGTQR